MRSSSDCGTAWRLLEVDVECFVETEICWIVNPVAKETRLSRRTESVVEIIVALGFESGNEAVRL